MARCVKCGKIINSINCSSCQFSHFNNTFFSLFSPSNEQLVFFAANSFKSMNTLELYLLARGGDPNAQYEFAYRHLYGVGSDSFFKDYKYEELYSDAFDWFTRSANKGNADAMYELAQLYEGKLSAAQECLKVVGRGKDDKRAFELYCESATKGNAKAMFKMGNLFYLDTNESIRNDLFSSDRIVCLINAISWYEKAASHGLELSRNLLNSVYCEIINYYTKRYCFDELVIWAEKAISDGLDVESYYDNSSFIIVSHYCNKFLTHGRKNDSQLLLKIVSIIVLLDGLSKTHNFAFDHLEYINNTIGALLCYPEENTVDRIVAFAHKTLQNIKVDIKPNCSESSNDVANT